MSNFRAHFLVPLNEITRIKVEILSCTLSSNTLMTHHVWILAQFGSWGVGVLPYAIWKPSKLLPIKPTRNPMLETPQSPTNTGGQYSHL